MSRRSLPQGRLLQLSDSLFRALLHVYPPAFRQAFGSEMAQVFRDDCRRAQAERGFAGVMGLWVLAAFDLIVTATQERLSKECHMSRTTFVRAAGAVALLGGVLNGLSFLSHPQGLARAVVPASVACLIVGILGLHALLWGREGRLGLLGFVLVGVGLALGFIGMAGSALGVVGPDPVAPIINTGEHAGLVFIGAGMLLWGIVTLREKALGRWSVLPLVIGLFGLSGIVFLVPEAFAVLAHSVLPEIFALSWILLGVALLMSRARPSPVPTRAAAI